MHKNYLDVKKKKKIVKMWSCHYQTTSWKVHACKRVKQTDVYKVCKDVSTILVCITVHARAQFVSEARAARCEGVNWDDRERVTEKARDTEHQLRALSALNRVSDVNSTETLAELLAFQRVCELGRLRGKSCFISVGNEFFSCCCCCCLEVKVAVWLRAPPPGRAREDHVTHRDFCLGFNSHTTRPYRQLTRLREVTDKLNWNLFGLIAHIQGPVLLLLLLFVLLVCFFWLFFNNSAYKNLPE